MDATLTPGYSFPAIRGVQAGRSYYISMCPMRLIPKIFLFDEEELGPELRAQRPLNKGRVPEIARYIVDNPDSYVFSALTASVDAELSFDSVVGGAGAQQIGVLRVPMEARFIINDGQHRRAAIEMAIRENPALANESIAVVFFEDHGLERCQQMFADLNRYAVKPSPSLSILYDQRDDHAQITKQVIFSSPVFTDVVELERTSLSLRSRKLFTLSAVHYAVKALLRGVSSDSMPHMAKLAGSYWEELAKHIPEWGKVRSGKLVAGQLRAKFIHSHAVTLQAFGMVGNALLKEQPDTWRKSLAKIRGLDFSRSNPIWNGRTLIAGKVNKGRINVVLTANVIKTHIGLELTAEEAHLEREFERGVYVN